MECGSCKFPKEDNEFNWQNKAAGLRHAVCKPCQRERSKVHYRANKEIYLEKKKLFGRRTQEQVNRFKAEKGCIDCPERDPRCLDMDHLDPLTKVGNVGKLARDWSFERLKTELDKCVVRCSNCHRKRTSVQFEWYK